MNVANSKKTRGRPFKDKEVAKMELLNSATKLFSTKGFEETSLREIALDADVNMALVQYHFGSKLNLWKGVITKLSEKVLEVNEFTVEEVDDDANMRALLVELFDRMVDMSFQHREFSLFIINETVQQGERFDHLFDKLIKPYHDQSYPFIVKGIELGILEDQHPEELIIMLLSSVSYQQAVPHLLGKFTNVTDDEEKWKQAIKHSLKVNFIK
ncbi:transcriptional regulator, TetR family [Gracilibacillus orientalis]|uniref:Transcriptional regulator, TetR family n=1 Tax=Gracilibacillus orientalis TaxID=334253 RepID=A0A1I4PER5_9BACI|nr:TetR family transcriptional regulator [Gracilibacillus orientalis]SFM26160.1 transcriptional regulator, TetR family [Gracilibacillus orientalis]